MKEREKSCSVNDISFFENFFSFINIFHQSRIINYIRPLGLETVIDIGAHKGEFASSILKIKNIKNIFCFEPQIKINDILVKKFSHIKKIKIFNCALDKVISKKYIYINKLTSCSTLQTFNKKSFYLKFKNFLQGNKENYVKKYKVKTNTIDNIFKNTNFKKCLLKIDVEGYEINVLKGSERTINNKIEYILIENQFGNHYKQSSKVTVFDYLKDNNYKILKKFTFPTLHFQDILFKKINYTDPKQRKYKTN
jgi:FkbM family methyltransferase